MTNSTVVVPVRGLVGGKTRLAPSLDQSSRSRVISGMLGHVLDVVQAVPFPTSILVVSGDGALLNRLARTNPRITTILQQDWSVGLNGGIDLGRAKAVHDASAELIVLSADLPLLTGDDLRLLRESAAQVTIATDRGRVGTNALLLRGSQAIAEFPFWFGPDSRSHHENAARAREFSHAVVELPGIQADLDTPDDWYRLDPGMRDMLLSENLAHDVRISVDERSFSHLEHV